MSTRTSPWPPGMPCWADLSVPDVEAACAFYGAVLGWEIPPAGPDDGGYRIALVDGAPVAGLGPMQMAEQPVAWLLYLATEDVDGTVAKVEANGGRVFVPAGDVGSHGRMAVAADPSGAAFGLWQARDHIGAARVNEPGALTWDDLRSADPAAAMAFYGAVFGYELHEVEMAPGDYRTFHLPGDPAPMGGMGGFMGPPTASHWLVYFGVADTDAAVAAARSAGGTVLMEPMTTPYGRMAAVQDPQGAIFQIITTGGDQPDRSG